MDSDKNITYAIVLSPPNLNRWKARVKESHLRASKKAARLLKAGRNPIITSRRVMDGHTMLYLASSDLPDHPVLTLSYNDVTSAAAEAQLIAKAGVEYRVAMEAVRAAQHLLDRIEDQDVDDADYRVIEWGNADITRRIGDMRRYEEEGRVISVDRVEIVRVEEPAPVAPMPRLAFAN